MLSAQVMHRRSPENVQSSADAESHLWHPACGKNAGCREGTNRQIQIRRPNNIWLI